MLHIAIVDDHPVARYGMTRILEAIPDLQTVAAVDCVAALPRGEDGRLKVDVVLLDLYLGDGQPALASIREISAAVPVLVVSASRAPADVLKAMQAGASGYLTKHAPEEAYVTAIRSVTNGAFYFSQLADVVQAVTQDDHLASDDERLSRREQEALTYIARGFTHQQTATRMGVSKATVDTYVARIRSKLGLGNKAELALAALRYLGRPR